MIIREERVILPPQNKKQDENNTRYQGYAVPMRGRSGH